MGRPLYDIIRENLVNGGLPRGFSLPSAEEETGPSFADGAKEGITVFHSQRSSMSQEMREMMEMAVEDLSGEFVSLAERKFYQLGEKCWAINGEDDLKEYIIQNSQKLSINSIFETAMGILKEGDRKEPIKYALVVLGMIRFRDEAAKEVIRTLALSDEFTYYALQSILRWDNCNEEVFNLIQKVYGWGRIFLLMALEPTTSEIKDWIFWNGLDNDVMSEYTAQAVWEKADVQSRIDGGLTNEEALNVDKIAEAVMEADSLFGGDDDWDEE